MQIHNAIITGSFSYNGADLSNVTSSNAYSASLSSRTTNLESTSSVLVGASSSFSSILTSVSSSQQQISASLLQVSASYIALSGSYNTFSGSASTRVSQIEQVYATTGSNSFRATQSITGSLTVTGQIVAQSINIQQVTSSIIYSSGSNVFGCDINSRQTFTGSIYQTGSLASFSGQVCVGSSLVLGTNNAYALYLKDSAGNPKPVMATAGNTNLNFYNVCSTGKININNAADNAVLVSIDNTGASTFCGQLCSITGVFGSKGGGNYGVLISDNDQSNVRLRFTNTGTGGTSMSIVGGTPGLSNSGLAIYDETNAATRMYITSCGYVGIGAAPLTSTAAALQIEQAQSNIVAIRRADCSNTGSSRILFQAYNVSGAQQNTGIVEAGLDSSATNGYLGFYAGTAAMNMKITSTGYVGVGTSTPLSIFHVNCCIAGGATTTVARFGIQDSTGYGTTSPAIELTGTNIGLCFTMGKIAGINDATSGGSLAFSTGFCAGTVIERMRITSCGSVGIGTSSPSTKVHVYGTASIFNGILLENSNSNAYSIYQAKTGNSSVWQWGVWNDNSYRIGVSAVADYMTITSCGSVGIGTTSPNSALEVNGVVRATSFGGSGYPYNGYYLGLADVSLSQLGAGSTSGYNSNVTVFGGGNATPNLITFTTTSTERMRITSCGKVGIGATDPKWLLEICANNACGGAGQYPALAINNACVTGYAGIYFYRGLDQMGGVEISNSTCNILINSQNGALNLQTAGTNRLTLNNVGGFGTQLCNFCLTGTYQTLITVENGSYGLLMLSSCLGGGTYALYNVFNNAGTTTANLLSGNNIPTCIVGNAVKVASSNSATYCDMRSSYIRFY